MRRINPPSVSDTDAAYIAGLFDGDGMLTVIDNTARAHVLAVNIGSTHLPVLEWLKFTLRFGTIHKKRCAGYPGQRKVMWYREADCHAAEVFIRTVYAHLKIKRERADAALTFREDQRQRGFSLIPGACLPIRAMNRPEASISCRFQRTA